MSQELGTVGGPAKEKVRTSLPSPLAMQLRSSSPSSAAAG